MKKYDLIVIGSGGGAKISTPAANMGKKVAIIEKDKLGGTCLNRGCIPSKMLIHPANVARIAKEARKLNINIKGPIRFNFKELVSRVSKVIDSESAGIGRSYKNVKNLDYYKGTAKFLSSKVVEINGIKITASKIVIAVGTRPNVPPIPGLAGTPFMTSTEALRSTKLPKKLIVIGGGYIAMELGTAYASFGSRVEFIVRSGFLRAEDESVQEEFTKVIMSECKVTLGFERLKVDYNKKTKIFTVIATSKSGKVTKSVGDALLMATCIVSNADTLSLKSTKVKTNSEGFIKVNRFLETSAKGVYAIGDVIGRYFFRHSVNFEGEYLFGKFFRNKNKPIRYPPMPHAVFSSPEVAGVGATEQELREKKVPYIAAINPYKASAQGMARRSDHGFVKLLFHKKSRKLLGAHAIGEESATLIHQAVQAMSMNATVDDLNNMIYIHPALSEILRNAARRAKMQFDGFLY